MGYTTEFSGQIKIEPALNQEEIEYLNKFSETRRMKRTTSDYYVDGGGLAGQDHEETIIDYNHPPDEQPGLWCQWVPTDDGKHIEWNQCEKFYESQEWMKYLIKHFIGYNPIAQSELPFLKGHTLNGTIKAQGEEMDDRWLLHVVDNVVDTDSLE